MGALVLPSKQTSRSGDDDAEIDCTTASPDTAAISVVYPLALQRGVEFTGEEGGTAYDSKLSAAESNSTRTTSMTLAAVPDSSSRVEPGEEQKLFLPDDDHEFFKAFAENLKRSVEESLHYFNETFVKKHKTFSEKFSQYFIEGSGKDSGGAP